MPSSSGLVTVSILIMALLADSDSIDRSLVIAAYQLVSGLLNLVDPTLAVAMAVWP